VIGLLGRGGSLTFKLCLIDCILHACRSLYPTVLNSNQAAEAFQTCPAAKAYIPYLLWHTFSCNLRWIEAETGQGKRWEGGKGEWRFLIYLLLTSNTSQIKQMRG